MHLSWLLYVLILFSIRENHVKSMHLVIEKVLLTYWCYYYAVIRQVAPRIALVIQLQVQCCHLMNDFHATSTSTRI